MAKMDDYKQALAITKEALEGKNPKRVAGNSGATFDADPQGKTHLILPFLESHHQ